MPGNMEQIETSNGHVSSYRVLRVFYVVVRACNKSGRLFLFAEVCAAFDIMFYLLEVLLYQISFYLKLVAILLKFHTSLNRH